jgi:hypothetical protein
MLVRSNVNDISELVVALIYQYKNFIDITSLHKKLTTHMGTTHPA